MLKSGKSSWILFMGTFPPRECGIATFTKDLTSSLDKRFSKLKTKILAMNRNSANAYNYSSKVVYQLDDSNLNDYIKTAEKINKKDAIKLVCIQHEFGIFGGQYGEYLIPFLQALKKPKVITFHSVLPEPDQKLREVVRSIAENVGCIVVMTEKAVDILRRYYNIEKEILVVPHGIPNVSYTSSARQKKKIGLNDNLIISSFGLIGPGKGYEYVIESLPRVIKKFPNLIYLIVGETHPVVRRRDGEAYREILEQKAKKLGLKNHVRFYNKYMNLGEIVKYLKATDIYISSGQNPNQITSGTLSYAMGCGRPVISTPFLHARDAVTDERGVLVDFEDSDSFADAIISLLSDNKKREEMGRKSYYFTRSMIWQNVALSYTNILNTYLPFKEEYEKLPDIKLNHISRLTDKFGIIQFAKQIKPDISSGYTLDDNARAMLICCMHYQLFRDESKIELLKKYLNFIKHAQQPDGKIYNYVDINKNIDLEQWSEDAHGRALKSLGYLISISFIPKEIRDEAEVLFNQSLKATSSVNSPRAIAFIISGLYYHSKSGNSLSSNSEIISLAERLKSLYIGNCSEDWKWFEHYLTYCNAVLPESLFFAYMATKDKNYLKIAKESLSFLLSVTFENGVYAPIGNRGWYHKDSEKAMFDQQPIDAAAMVQLLILANAVTKEEEYLKCAFKVFQWFLGSNSLNQVIYNETTAGCHDGIGENSINLNQGAESTIAYFMARLPLELIQKQS